MARQLFLGCRAFCFSFGYLCLDKHGSIGTMFVGEFETRAPTNGMGIHYRSWEVAEEVGKNRVEGYAALFNSPTKIRTANGHFNEMLLPGAFAQSLLERDIFALRQHRMELLLGSTESGTLQLREDEKGLWFGLDLPNTAIGQETLELIKSKVLGGMSFGFNEVEGGTTFTRSNNELNATIANLDMREVSVVPNPYYKGTTIEYVGSGRLAKRAEAILAEPDPQVLTNARQLWQYQKRLELANRRGMTVLS